jgi:hypothetical protein
MLHKNKRKNPVKTTKIKFLTKSLLVNSAQNTRITAAHQTQGRKISPVPGLL